MTGIRYQERPERLQCPERLTRVEGVAAAEYLVRSSSQGERACWEYLYAMC